MDLNALDTPLLERMVAALERIAPPPATPIDWRRAPAYVWDGRARAVARIEAPALDLLRGIDAQKALVVENVARLAAGRASHDLLLWGARGMGKSAVLRAAIATEQATGGVERVALVQVAPAALDRLSDLFAQLGDVARRFLVFIDDLGFEAEDAAAPRALRSWLEGGVEARPGNVRLAVTSNRRAIVARQASEQDDPLNPRDVVDDRLALADRFGLSIGFHNCTQEDYLAIIGGYAAALGLAWDAGEALEWSRRRGGRSGRVAAHFMTEIAGRAAA